jgi:hypothetical protein
MTSAETQKDPAAFDYQASAVKIARRGARRLAKLVQPEGRFVYRYDREKKRIYNQYNVLRHCGSAWSMFDVVRMTGPDPVVTAAAVNAARYMRENFIRPFKDGDALCVVDGDKIKLGGSGLALLALAELHRFAPDPEIVETARAIGRYILSQRTEDGDLHHGRNYPDGELYDFRSNYYTGEAIFGLLRLSELTGEEAWRDAAFELLAALGPRDYGVEVRSHWMLYALDAADEVRPSAENRAYAARIAARILRDPISYRGRELSTPIACMSEALLAYIRLKRRAAAASLYPSVSDCGRAVLENLSLQTKSFRKNGEFMAGPQRRDVRIDYIQHNISSFAAFGTMGKGLIANPSPRTAPQIISIG